MCLGNRIVKKQHGTGAVMSTTNSKPQVRANLRSLTGTKPLDKKTFFRAWFVIAKWIKADYECEVRITLARNAESEAFCRRICLAYFFNHLRVMAASGVIMPPLVDSSSDDGFTYNHDDTPDSDDSTSDDESWWTLIGKYAPWPETHARDEPMTHQIRFDRPLGTVDIEGTGKYMGSHQQKAIIAWLMNCPSHSHSIMIDHKDKPPCKTFIGPIYDDMWHGKKASSTRRPEGKKARRHGKKAWQKPRLRLATTHPQLRRQCHPIHKEARHAHEHQRSWRQ